MGDAGEWPCIWCGAVNVYVADRDDGASYELVEDCEVCCRPHRLVVRADWAAFGGQGEVVVDAESAG